MARGRVRGLHPALLLGGYVALALAPLALAYAQGLPPRPFPDELSSALALVAFAMLLMEFVLSGRFKTVSGRVGIDLTMRFHQLIARAVLVFVLIHPFIYTTPMGFALPWDATGQERLGLDGASIMTGIAAWVLLALIVVTAIFRRRLPYSYETWRLGHGLGSALLAGFAAHHTVAAGRYSQDPWLAGFWLVLLAVALLTLAFVYVVRPLLQWRRPYAVTDVKKLAERTWELRLRAEGHGGLGFHAGQFAWLKLGRHPFHITEHPFSISSAPHESPEIGFTIKEAGDFTGRIGSVRPGTRGYLDAPHGNFVLAGRKAEGIAFLAGGVGIAPVLGLLRALRAERDARPMALVYGNRVAEQIVAGDELDAMARELDLKVHHVLAEPPAAWCGHRGQITARVLDGCLPKEGRKEWLYFVCGPGPMIDAVEDELQKLGIPLNRVVSEKFDYDRQPSTIIEDEGKSSMRHRMVMAVSWGTVLLVLLAAFLFALR